MIHSLDSEFAKEVIALLSDITEKENTSEIDFFTSVVDTTK